MNKTPTKQYFADALADQQGVIRFLRLMPNNINTCKLIEHTLTENGYEYVVNIPGYKKQQQAKYITNRNIRTKRMYIVVWNDCTYDYATINAGALNIPCFYNIFPCTYVTSRNVVEATLQAIEVLKHHNEQCKED
jgi:hypothetical protein|nr:MAG TPA: hypothetical protein [Caudoviricetes sp.]